MTLTLQQVITDELNKILPEKVIIRNNNTINQNESDGYCIGADDVLYSVNLIVEEDLTQYTSLRIATIAYHTDHIAIIALNNIFLTTKGTVDNISFCYEDPSIISKLAQTIKDIAINYKT